MYGNTWAHPKWATLERFEQESGHEGPGTKLFQTLSADSPRGIQDVDMVSVESSHEEYDPDDLTFSTPTRATMASAMAGGPSTIISHIRVSASLDLKEFSGRDNDEDRAQNWSTKVKTAFIEDQASDNKKCLLWKPTHRFSSKSVPTAGSIATK